jgi:hypothetical protein
MNEKDVRKVIDGMVSGRIRHPRFTKYEVGASSGIEHEKLWATILSLEPARSDFGGRGEIRSSQGGAYSRSSEGLGRLGDLATRYGRYPNDVKSENGHFFDFGRESHVYRISRGAVVKVRRINAVDIDGAVGELSKIVYHNYLFPDDAYVLNEIVVYNDNGFDKYYMILEQRFVEPLIDSNRIIILPTEAQIAEALTKTPEQFTLHRSICEDSDGEDVEAGRLIAYNEQFLVYDFQPGRNTFIDASTGKIRFIDPRVSLNDPALGFAGVSQFGKRNAGGFIESKQDYDEFDGYEDIEEYFDELSDNQ